MQVSRKLLGISLVLALTLALVAQVALASPVSPSKGTGRIVQAQATATETTVADTTTPVATDTTVADTTTPAATDTTAATEVATAAATETLPAETATVQVTAAATGTSTAPTTLPVTGGGDGQSNWLIPLLLVGGVLLLLGAYVRRSAR
jgi:microcystin-dependent protein